MLEVATQYGRIVKSQFTPAFGIKNPHLQTILPKFVIDAPDIDFKQERIATPDNDFVDLAWAVPSRPKAMLVLFHGLEGSSSSHYIKHAVDACNKVDIGCVVMHFRGCSSEPNLQVKAYHSGATFDPEFIVPIIKARYSQLALFATGFSLGANMLLKLLANRPDLPIKAGIAVSAPLNLSASSVAINHGFSRLYQWHLMKSMKANIINKMSKVDMSKSISVSPTYINQMTTFREFDDHITSVTHGFKDANDYYQQCSAITMLPDITKPTLIIHAKDDPFMNDKVIPEASLINSNVAYELSEYGGHVGFLSHFMGNNKLWLPGRIVAFIEENL